MSASVSDHHRNLQLLLTKIYKAVNSLNPTFMAEEFVINHVSYNRRDNDNLVLSRATNSLHGVGTIKCMVIKIGEPN